MSSDDMIWQVVNHQFCSFKTTIGKAKSDKTHFCRNPYSVTGLCNRTSCPLANSKYATIRENDGRIQLCIKTVERAHSPKNLWEKILLSRNYGKALQQIDEHLAYFPKAIIHRNKQRLTKIHQYLIRMRKIELKKRAGRKAKMVGIHRKIEQREERREQKALIAAKLERNIEKELVERLAKGTYGDIYNFPEMPYQKALDQVEEETELEPEEEEEEEMDGMVEYVEDLEESDEEEEEEEDIEGMDYLGNNEWVEQSDDESDLESEGSDDRSSADHDDESSKEDATDTKKKPVQRKKQAKKRGPRIEIEYEQEQEDMQRSEPITVQADW
jgi:protein MAK16